MQSRRSNISRRRFTDKNPHTVWAEPKKTGGYIIYAGIKGTEAVSIVGGAQSSATLDYNLRKAKRRFNHRSN